MSLSNQTDIVTKLDNSIDSLFEQIDNLKKENKSLKDEVAALQQALKIVEVEGPLLLTKDMEVKL